MQKLSGSTTALSFLGLVKYFSLLISVFLISTPVFTQVPDEEAFKKQFLKDFNQYKEQQIRDFKAYRDKLNAEYAEFMRQPWREYDSKPAQPVPKRPEPPKPVVKDPDIKPTIDKIPFDKVVIPYKQILPSKPLVLPVPPKAVKKYKEITFSYYGCNCSIKVPQNDKFHLKGIDENSIADAWKFLSSDLYTATVSDCLFQREMLDLCDWGYLRLVEQFILTYLCSDRSKNRLNEARLMQIYILSQSGIKVRMARTEDEELVLLIPFDAVMYKYRFIPIDGQKYYIVNNKSAGTKYYLLDHGFPEETAFSLHVSPLPELQYNRGDSVTLSAKNCTETTVNVNLNLIDFFNDYPLSSSYDIYIEASLSTEVKHQLYPALKQAIKGKSESEAANILLNFVQTAFKYKTDNEQFGYERALFGDEIIFYPYSDCEDRSILFSILVRDLLNLNVALLLYPSHVATSVCFNEKIIGDYFMLDNLKYTVCDPTYIGASIGESMPQFRNTSAKIIMLNKTA